MNRLPCSLIGAIALAIFSLPVQNAFSLPFHDPFGYADTADLAGQVSPEGTVWYATGTSTVGADSILVTANNLTYPGLADSSSNAVVFGSDGLTYRVAINPGIVTETSPGTYTTNAFGITDGTMFYSYIFLVQNLGNLNANGSFFSAFNNSVGTQTGQPTILGARLYTRLNATADGYNVGIAKAPPNTAYTTNVVWATNEFVVGQTNFIVASDTVVPGASNDLARMWINPDPATFGKARPPTDPAYYYESKDTLDKQDTAGADISPIRSFVLRQATTIQVGQVVIDEIRVGPTWGCVTPAAGSLPSSRPTVAISTAGSNSVLTWPTNGPTCFVLQSAANLTNVIWNTLANPVEIVDINFTVTNAISTNGQFYRLQGF